MRLFKPCTGQIGQIFAYAEEQIGFWVIHTEGCIQE